MDPLITLKPGPQKLAAAVLLAGFSAEPGSSPDGTFTDACGVTWTDPSELLIIVSIAGGESSGNAWATHSNDAPGEDGSTDYGIWQINGAAHSRHNWFGPVKSAAQLNWASYADNAVMARQVYLDAKASLPDASPWRPWMAYLGGGYKAERYSGLSWVSWAQVGIQQLEHAQAAGILLTQIASFSNDPLVYPPPTD